MKANNTARQIWLQLEATISEGVSLPDAPAITGQHPSGRQVHMDSSGELAFILGVSAGGLRTAAWLNNQNQALTALQQATRQLLPIIVVIEPGQSRLVMDSGAFVLRATNARELIDLTLIAHYVAERALVPGVLIYAGDPLDSAYLPDQRLIQQYLGDADDRIAVPTEAQQMLFGKTRRRIPRQFHPDIPVMSGVAKSPAGLAYESAARQAFFSATVDEFLEAARAEFATLFGTQYQALKGKNTERGGLLLVSDAPEIWTATEELKTKSRFMQLELHQLQPVPLALKKVAEKATTVVSVEASHSSIPVLARLLQAGLAYHSAPVYAASYVHSPEAMALQDFLQKAEERKITESLVWLDVPYYLDHSNYPKKQVLMQDVQRAYPNLKPAPATAKEGTTRLPDRIPMVLRKSKDLGPAYARTTHFYDTTAFFYEGSNEWTADPFQAMPVMPPATAALGREAMQRTKLPVLDTSRCTGCGECLIHCPHSALPSLVTNFETLLQSGIQQAQLRGHVITQLFPQIKNLAKVANSYASAHQQALNSKHQELTIAHLLTPAFEDFLIRGKHTEERENSLRQEFNAVLDVIGPLPAVITARFFNDSTKELFSLNIAPHACTGCSICAAVCPEDAFRMEEETPALHTRIQRQFALWEQVPDTSGDTIQRLMDDAGYPSLAALMLSRNYYESLTGASDPAHAGVKTIIHLITSVAEVSGQQASRTLLKQLDSLSEAIKSQLNSELSSALPEVDVATLSGSLDQIQTAHLTLDELLARGSNKKSGHLLDKAVLQRKLGLLRQLEDLGELITSGISGEGRARYTVALDHSLHEVATFPVNSFTVPVMTFNGNTPGMALGLVRAHIRHLLDNIKIIRRAGLEQNNQYNPIIHDAQIVGLTWEDLTEAEKAMVPPLLLITRQSFLDRQSSSSLAGLLDQGLPVKVFVLDEVKPGFDPAATHLAFGPLSLAPYLGLQSVQAGQFSLANPDHLFNGLFHAMGKPGAALLRLLAPDVPHGNPQLLHQLASETRTWVLLDYQPDRPGQLIMSRLHLQENPDLENEWVHRIIHYGTEDEPQEVDYEMTPADWFYVQPEYRSGYSPWMDNADQAVPVATYLRQDPQDRRSMVPVIFRVNDQGELVKYSVPAVIVKAAAAAGRSWQLLREIGGELTEFPEKLQKKVASEMKEQYEKEKANMIEQNEQQIRELEAVHLEKMRAQIKSKLMQMAGWNG